MAKQKTTLSLVELKELRREVDKDLHVPIKYRKGQFTEAKKQEYLKELDGFIQKLQKKKEEKSNAS